MALYTVKGREKIASLVAAVGLTASYIPPTAPKTYYAMVQAIGGDVRFTIDGTTTPTSTVGMRLIEDGTLELWGEEMANFRAINDGGTATLEVSYHGGA